MTSICLGSIPAEEFLQYWSSVDNIDASELIQFCTYNNLCNLPTDPPDGLISRGAMYVVRLAPEEDVETSIQNFFDVSSEYLKTAREYDAKTDTYLQPFGYGGSGILQLVSAKRQGDILTLGIRIGSVANPSTIDGELKIHLEEEGDFK